MQRIVNELNLSEPAFLLQLVDNPADYKISSFKPAEEVDFYGQATIAARIMGN
ncbi:PhzF family phenazine biosynthesis protein [Niallia circulans]|uniref:PhzF family phenazine biosynthesis protein n=2 Tax=Niallia circulans TaxID=1397 RepID=A0A553SLY4_NIACI|nr:PhzF family phenazine biosynthesis protein [Niallia circulans]